MTRAISQGDQPNVHPSTSKGYRSFTASHCSRMSRRYAAASPSDSFWTSLSSSPYPYNSTSNHNFQNSRHSDHRWQNSHHQQGNSQRRDHNYNEPRGYGKRYPHSISHHHNQQKMEQGNIPVFTSSAKHCNSSMGLRNDARNGIGMSGIVKSESAVVVWCEDGVGEVLSPTNWKMPRLHLVFDKTTRREGECDGWDEKNEIERVMAGMEVDVHFQLPPNIQSILEKDTTSHYFLKVDALADLQVPKLSSITTKEQLIVIARRSCGTSFLLSNSGERVALHPHFIHIPCIREAIKNGRTLVKLQGEEAYCMDELVCNGRTLTARLAPSPPWVPTCHAASDYGIGRWVIEIEPYGDLMEGRAVVSKAYLHFVLLQPIDGPLANTLRSSLIHCALIPLENDMREQLQEEGSVWKIVGCRELPGRTCQWRTLRVERSQHMTQTVPSLIDVTGEWSESDTVSAVPSSIMSSVMAELSEISFDKHYEELMSKPNEVMEEEEIIRFESIDEEIEREDFVDNVYRQGTLIGEAELIGCSPQDMQGEENERVGWPLLPQGQFRFGDERPDMRVEDARHKAIKRAAVASMERREKEKEVRALREKRKEELEMRMRDLPAVPDALADLVQHSSVSNGEATSTLVEDHREKKKRKAAENMRTKTLQAIGISNIGADDNLFNLMMGQKKGEEKKKKKDTDDDDSDEIEDREGSGRKRILVQILPLPDKCKYAGGWWFRPSHLRQKKEETKEKKSKDQGDCIVDLLRGEMPSLSSSHVFQSSNPHIQELAGLF